MLTKRVLAGVGAVIFVASCFLVASGIESRAQENEIAANSAPQQSAAEGLATREAGVNGLRLLGVLGGLIVFNLALLAPATNELQERDDAKAIMRGERKACPHCDELVRPAARVCRFCGRDLPIDASNERDEDPAS